MRQKEQFKTSNLTAPSEDIVVSNYISQLHKEIWHEQYTKQNSRNIKQN